MMRSSAFRLLLAIALIGAVPQFVRAQAIELQPDTKPQYSACVASTTPGAVGPAYPPTEMAREGVVRVLLYFGRPDMAPAVRVTYNNAGEAFADAVTDFVATYRAPCLPRGEEFAATQEFQFKRQGGLISGKTLPQQRYLELPAECLDFVQNWPKPKHPDARGSANLLVEYRFEGPDVPPSVKVLYDGGDKRYTDAILALKDEFRIPCIERGKPILALQEFRFTSYDGRHGPRLISEITLVQLLRIIKASDKQGLRFDFRTMSCPFEVMVAPRLPYASNKVVELGTPSADRATFLEWLRDHATFDIPPHLMPSMFGEPTKVRVPCALLDLT